MYRNHWRFVASVNSENSDEPVHTHSLTKPFPSSRHILTTLQQTSFENIVTKEEIACFEQLFSFLTMFKLFFSNYTFIYRDFQCFAWVISKSSAADLLYVGKGLVFTVHLHFRRAICITSDEKLKVVTLSHVHQICS